MVVTGPQRARTRPRSTRPGAPQAQPDGSAPGSRQRCRRSVGARHVQALFGRCRRGMRRIAIPLPAAAPSEGHRCERDRARGLWHADCARRRLARHAYLATAPIMRLELMGVTYTHLGQQLAQTAQDGARGPTSPWHGPALELLEPAAQHVYRAGGWVGAAPATALETTSAGPAARTRKRGGCAAKRATDLFLRRRRRRYAIPLASVRTACPSPSGGGLSPCHWIGSASEGTRRRNA